MSTLTTASSSSSLPLAATPQQRQPHIFSISCTTCRQRKIKCTRTSPCLPCQQAGYDCEFPERQRVPRMKRGKMIPRAKVTDLADRLAGVEMLLHQIIAKENDQSAEGTRTDTDSLELSPDGDVETSSSNTLANAEERYADCPFWKTLCEQVGGLQQLIGHSPESKALDQTPEPFSSLMFVGNRSSPSGSQTLPSLKQATALLDTFITNVDPVVKLLHIPSLRQRIGNQFSVPENGAEQRPMDVLVAAVFFASTTSMTEEECHIHLQVSRKTALPGFRSAVEDGLARANFVRRAEMTTLQALVLFLACLPSTDKSKAPWTMVAVAVRLAHMLNLHRDGQGLQYTPFEAEMRRRLWWQIVLLDMRVSEDWGSDFMISEDSYNTCVPTNINDSDMEGNASSTYLDRKGVTQMTFGLIFREARKLVKLFQVPLDEQQPRHLQERLEIFLRCQEELNENFFPHYNSDAPISWATHTIGRLIIYKAWLMVHYPMSPQDWTAMDTTVRREDLIMTSVMILELSYKLESNEDVKQWWWLFQTYVQWHALAVTLVELCVQKPSPLMDKAWEIIDTVFDLWSRRVVDSSAGFVWLPIKKLYAKAHEVRISSTSNLTSAPKIHDALPTPPDAPQNYDKVMDHTNAVQDRMVATMLYDISSTGYDPVQTELNISTFNLGGWDFVPFTHDDPAMQANWADWDGFLRDVSGLPDPGFMP